MRKYIALTAALCAMATALTACGTTTENQNNAVAEVTGNAQDATVTAQDENSTPATKLSEDVDFADDGTTQAAAQEEAAPFIEILSGDAEGIKALAKQAQNFEIAEGTKAHIIGFLSLDTAVPAIQEDEDDATRVGISMYVDGDWEPLPADTVIDVIGEFKRGDYFMEFHVNSEDIVAVLPANE